MNMNTITLYKISDVYRNGNPDYYSLTPWNQPVTNDGAIDARHVEREDDGGREYTLPADATWEVAETTYNELWLWRNNVCCNLTTHINSGLPMIVADGMWVLKPA